MLYWLLDGLKVTGYLPNNMVTLLLASRADNASVNLHDAVVSLGGWNTLEVFPHGLLMRHTIQPVHLLLIEKLHIYADGIDLIHEKETSEAVDEVLVLSRHAAKSGRPSLLSLIHI